MRAQRRRLGLRAVSVRRDFRHSLGAVPQWSAWRNILAQNTNEFCSNTTIHGLKYLNNSKLRPVDRVFFGLALLGVLLFAGFLILDAFEKWYTTPVIVAINPKPTYITNEPFPAVTICNLNQAMAIKAKQFAPNTAEYAMLQLLCHRNVDPRLTDAISNWGNLEEFIYNISQSCHDMIIGCQFGAKQFRCSRMFYPIVTDEGLCCVFNMLHPRYMYKHNVPGTLRHILPMAGYQAVNWYAEQGYPSHLHDRFYPQAAQGTGESLGLTLILDVQADDYYCSSSNSVGFKIALHSPNESPNVRETGMLLAPGLETKLRIEPFKIVTEQHLRSLDRKYRRCLFHGEGKLRYFAHYTQRNCEMECHSKLLLQHCGCISFYMPRINGNDTVCSIRKSTCVESVRLHTAAEVESCLDNCLPSCFDLTFNAVAYSAKISHDGFAMSNALMLNRSHAYVERSVAVVNMYYKEHTFRAQTQTEFIGISDFLSSVGGLMGLFLGFSFLSIAECIYFALIRPCRTLSDLRRQGAVSTLQLNQGKLLAPALTLELQLPRNTLINVKEAVGSNRRSMAPYQPNKWFDAELGYNKQMQRFKSETLSEKF